MKQHEARKKELEQKRERAANAEERQALEKAKAIEENEKRHKLNLEVWKEEYKAAEEPEQNIANEVTKELEKTREDYEASLKKIDKFLATNAPHMEEKEAEEEESDLDRMAGMTNVDIIKEHLETDGTLTRKEVTPDIIATSIVGLLQKLLTPKEAQEEEVKNMEV